MPRSEVVRPPAAPRGGSARRAFVLLCALAAGAPTAPCASADRLGLDDVLADARRANPEIVAARERARALAAVPRRVGALDDPTFSWEVWNAPDSFRPDRADNDIFRLAQKLPFPGKRPLARDVATQDADAAARDADAVELDVVAAVKRAYWDLWGAHELHDVYAREQALVERVARVAARKYGVNEVSQSDVLRSQVELTHVVNQVTTQAVRVDAARAELNVLLSRDPAEPLGVPDAPPAPALDEDPASLIALALATRPELASQRAMVAREDAGVRLARRERYPDFELAVSRFVNPHARDGFGAMAAVTLPLVQRGKYDAAVGEASARLAAAEADRRRVEDRVRGDVQAAFLRARAALVQRDLLVGTHIPQAEQSLRVAESGYESGGVDFLALVDTARTIEMVHVEHVEMEVAFARAVADLERAIGGPLPAVRAGRPRHEMRGMP